MKKDIRFLKYVGDMVRISNHVGGNGTYAHTGKMELRSIAKCPTPCKWLCRDVVAEWFARPKAQDINNRLTNNDQPVLHLTSVQLNNIFILI